MATTPTNHSPTYDNELHSPCQPGRQLTDEYNNDKQPAMYDKHTSIDMDKSGTHSADHSDTDSNMDQYAISHKQMRTAGALNAFFLICTDELGPAQAPYGIATLGYVGGALLYLAMGVLYIYTSLMLVKLYTHYNNEVNPIRTYGSLMEAVFARYGPRAQLYAKWFTVVLQILQLWLMAAVAILGSAQAMFQISGNNICFVAFSAIYTAVACIVGCIRHLKNLSALSAFAMAANIAICYATISVAASSPAFTNYAHASPSSLFQAGFIPYDPVTGEGLQAVGGVAFQKGLPLEAIMSGVSTMIYAYAGSTIFVEIMAEMREPARFRIAFIWGMVVIIAIYLSFGLGMYAIQGVYSANPANQGLTPFAPQTALNVITVLTLVISGCLYAHAGCKVVYGDILQPLLKAPALNTSKGQLWWSVLAFCFWWSAFVLAEVVPQFSAFTGIVSSIVMMQFSYILPALMNVMHEVAEGRDKQSSGSLFTKMQNSFDVVVLIIGGLALSGLGAWGSILTLISALNTGSTSIFGCNGP